MSCGQKAVSDDEDDWYDFKEKHNLNNCSWTVYSAGAIYAVMGATQLGLTSTMLEDFVLLMFRRDEYNKQRKLEETERKEYARLHEKYGNN